MEKRPGQGPGGEPRKDKDRDIGRPAQQSPQEQPQKPQPHKPEPQKPQSDRDGQGKGDRSSS